MCTTLQLAHGNVLCLCCILPQRLKCKMYHFQLETMPYNKVSSQFAKCSLFFHLKSLLLFFFRFICVFQILLPMFYLSCLMPFLPISRYSSFFNLFNCSFSYHSFPRQQHRKLKLETRGRPGREIIVPWAAQPAPIKVDIFTNGRIYQ